MLRTTSITRGAIAATSLRPPPGYKERTLLDSTPLKQQARSATIPALPLRCAILACGPISSHPDLWAFYWGTTFKGRRDVVSSINHALQNFVGDQFADPFSQNFWGPLSQYGVGRGRDTSPATHLAAPQPPTLLLYADGDDAARRQESLDYGARLTALGGTVVVREIAGRDHRSIFTRMTAPDDPTLAAVLDFLRQHL